MNKQEALEINARTTDSNHLQFFAAGFLEAVSHYEAERELCSLNS